MFARLLLFSSLCLLLSCQRNMTPTLVSLHLVDQNGLSEMIQSQERLQRFSQVNFYHPQPYQKVLRTFSKDTKGCSPSILTSYHKSGNLKQYLEATNCRACGRYLEWHANGKLHIYAHVLSGTADLNCGAESSWIFDGTTFAWNEEGVKIAEIPYSHGLLEGEALYFYNNGALWRRAPYHQGRLEGIVWVYSPEGQPLREEHYLQGKREGTATSWWQSNAIASQETYSHDLLWNAIFYSPSGAIIAQVRDGNGWQPRFNQEQLIALEQIQGGKVEGLIEEKDDQGKTLHSYHLKNDCKDGIELFFYPQSTQPRLSISWQMGVIQGMCKSWYPSGVLESERLMHQNQKNGPLKAWFADGSLMLIEEYEQDRLLLGQYFRPNSLTPLSLVQNGNGVATLFDQAGHFLQRITYIEGHPKQY